MSTVEKVELAAYQLKYVAQIMENSRSLEVVHIDWKLLSQLSLGDEGG